MTTTLQTFRLTFFVPGNPAAQGSKRHIGGGRLIEQSANVGPWRERIAIAAYNFRAGTTLPLPLSGRPIGVIFKFVMPRPASTPKTRGTPPAIKRPDLDKLCRAVFDALTGIIYSDDSCIVHLEAHKRLAEPNETPGVHISIEALP